MYLAPKISPRIRPTRLYECVSQLVGDKIPTRCVHAKVFPPRCQSTDSAWFSDTDISAGERWGLELANQLEATDFGIICVTEESLQSSWMLFEAGAIGKSVKGGRVCPYLVDVTKRQLAGPLSQFQAKEATKEGTWEMLQSLNLAMNSDALPEIRPQRYHDTFWPTLEAELVKLNRELQFLPLELRKQFLETLPQFFYKVEQIEMFAVFAGLPIWNVNLNQAAIHVWRELIDVATAERKLTALLDVLMKDYSRNTMIQDLHSKVRDWELSRQEVSGDPSKAVEKH